MSKHSGIDYADASWGTWRGCRKVSRGCQHCYAERAMSRFGLDFHTVTRASKKTFKAPLRWKEPLRILVCPWSDFFHPDADPWRRDALVMMDCCDRHTFIVPTKRPERMVKCLYEDNGGGALLGSIQHMENVWFLVSVEDQATADERIPELLRLREFGNWPVLGVSYEPALGPVDYVPYMGGFSYRCSCGFHRTENEMVFEGWVDYQNRKMALRCRVCGEICKVHSTIDWIVMGGESGPHARPMHPDWVRQTRDACVETGTPLWFKQWGEWADAGLLLRNGDSVYLANDWDILAEKEYANGEKPEFNVHRMVRVGRKAAGHLIDGQEWRQIPEGA